MLQGLGLILKHGRTVFTLIGSAVALVEALGAAAGADGTEKREMAVDRVREGLAALGIDVSESLLGPLVDLVVWFLNAFTGGGWTNGAAELADATADTLASAEAESASVRVPATKRAELVARNLEDIETSVRAEFDAIAKRNGGTLAGAGAE